MSIMKPWPGTITKRQGALCHLQANEISQRIMQEMQAHTELCKIADVTMAEVQSTPEHQGSPAPFRRVPSSSSSSNSSLALSAVTDSTLKACTAYTRYVLDVGQCGDWLALQMALAPCLLGYGAVARILMALPSTLREGNPYWPWIETYAADDYVSAVDLGSRKLFLTLSHSSSFRREPRFRSHA